MADEQLTTFKLDLDSEDFTNGLSSIKDTISSIGEAGSLEGLISGLSGVAEAAGIVGTAALAFKKTLDLVLDDEKIKQTQIAFDNLTKSVGISGDTLREGLVQAAGGLLTENQLLAEANKALVTMGASAQKLPEVMELARKATVLFGGTVQDNFNNLTQAIAMGNTRMLKHMGIIIDTNKAYEDFARANGISVSAMSEAAKQQAVLNAVLDYGKERFAGINTDTLKATNSWAQFKTTIREFGEAFASVFDKYVGPAVNAFLQMTSRAITLFKDLMLMVGGSEAEKAKASIEYYNNSVQSLNETIKELEKRKLYTTNPAEIAQINLQIEYSKKAIDEAKQSAQKYNEQLKEMSTQKPGSNIPTQAAPSLVDPEKQKAEYSKFQSELLKIHEERIKQELNSSRSEAEQDAIFNQMKLENKKAADAKIAEIESSKEFNPEEKAKLRIAVLQDAAKKEESIDDERYKKKLQLIQEQAKYEDDEEKSQEQYDAQREVAEKQHELRKQQITQNELLDDKQKKLALIQEERAYQNELYKIQEAKFNDDSVLIDNWEKHADGKAQEFARGFAAQSKRAKMSLLDFTKHGEQAFNIMTSQAESAFEKLGQGVEKGSDIMRGAMLGMIADIAEAYGKTMLEASLFPPNPALMAAGAALLVLAGYLRSQASSSAGISAPGGGTDVSGQGTLGGAPSANADTGSTLDQRQAKAVHIEVHGSILDSEATATRIAELVRQAADSTDFRISRIGGGI